METEPEPSPLLLLAYAAGSESEGISLTPMEPETSPLLLLANVAGLVSEGLSLTPSTETQETGVDKLWEMRGRDVKFVVEKTLTATDINRHRLSIPEKKMKQKFLTDEEIRTLENKEGIEVSLVEPCLQVSRRFQLKKFDNHGKSFCYMLTADARLYERNELTKDDPIQLCSFRVDGNLGFFLMKV